MGKLNKAQRTRYTSGTEWTVEFFGAAEAEIEALPAALCARLVRLLGVVENVGLVALRVTADYGIGQGIYVTTTGRRVVVLHVFAQKFGKTPGRALEAARESMRQVTS